MFAVLIAVRDFLLAAALAWVGVTLETRTDGANCAGERCQIERDR